VEGDAVDGERAGDAEGDGDVADDVLAAGAEDLGVIVAFVGDIRGFQGLRERGAGCVGLVVGQ
jgi:hypothetical protein